MTALPDYTAFATNDLLASGDLATVAAAAKSAPDAATLLVVDNRTGRPVDLDLRGTLDEVLGRLITPEPAKAAGERTGRSPAAAEPSSAATEETAVLGTDAPARGPGRPKLGVVAREVTLLPRHWEFLRTQPGGASVTLRRLIDEARQRDGSKTAKRGARDVAYHFMTAIAGDAPGYEAAVRALYAGDRVGFEATTAGWPADVRDHARRLAETGF